MAYQSYSGIASGLNSWAIDNLNKYGNINEEDYVSQAATDNTLAFSKAFDAAARNMERMGINPNSGRFAGMSQDYAIRRAAAEAGARNRARLSVRQQNFNNAQSAARLALQYKSLSNQLRGSQSAGKGKNKQWGIGNFNENGNFEKTVQSYDPSMGMNDFNARTEAFARRSAGDNGVSYNDDPNKGYVIKGR